MIDIDLRATIAPYSAPLVYSDKNWNISLSDNVAVVTYLCLGIRVIVDGDRVTCVRQVQDGCWNTTDLIEFLTRSLSEWIGFHPHQFFSLLNQQYHFGIAQGYQEAQCAMRHVLGLEGG
jgi:hypothetical protein